MRDKTLKTTDDKQFSQVSYIRNHPPSFCTGLAATDTRWIGKNLTAHKLCHEKRPDKCIYPQKTANSQHQWKKPLIKVTSGVHQTAILVRAKKIPYRKSFQVTSHVPPFRHGPSRHVSSLTTPSSRPVAVTSRYVGGSRSSWSESVTPKNGTNLPFIRKSWITPLKDSAEGDAVFFGDSESFKTAVFRNKLSKKKFEDLKKSQNMFFPLKWSEFKCFDCNANENYKNLKKNTQIANHSTIKCLFSMSIRPSKKSFMK